MNAEIVKNASNEFCPKCGSSQLKNCNAIEIGHTFFLGSSYSSKLHATIRRGEFEEVPLQMGCYGIGLTRLLAALLERNTSLSSERISWPAPRIAPYLASIIPVSMNRFESQIHQLIQELENENLSDSIILDDRPYELHSFGFKIKESESIGIPVRILVGKTSLDGNYEVEMDGIDKTLLSAKDIALLLKKLMDGI